MSKSRKSRGDWSWREDQSRESFAAEIEKRKPTHVPVAVIEEALSEVRKNYELSKEGVANADEDMIRLSYQMERAYSLGASHALEAVLKGAV